LKNGSAAVDERLENSRQQINGLQRLAAFGIGGREPASVRPPTAWRRRAFKRDEKSGRIPRRDQNATNKREHSTFHRRALFINCCDPYFPVAGQREWSMRSHIAG
jgi:hypothetical protein